MGIIADLAAFCSDLVNPCFVDSFYLLCYTIDVIAKQGLHPKQVLCKLLYMLKNILPECFV